MARRTWVLEAGVGQVLTPVEKRFQRSTLPPATSVIFLLFEGLVLR